MKGPGVFDPLANERETPDRPPFEQFKGEGERTDGPNGKPPPPMVQFFKLSELRTYEPPPNQNMVGDYHVQRGNMTVLAGPPGCGKSRAALWLAIIGAQGGGEWFGYQVHGGFRTLILQNENGLPRLHRDVKELGLSDDLDESIRISAPPVLGLDLTNIQFRNELKAAVRTFCPDLIIIDPWNAVARDAMEKDYQQAFAQVREVLSELPDRPACLIIHHLRKPKSEDRHRGRSLTNLLAGSYTIISVPRAVFVLQPASDDTKDCRVLITPAKNNDGDLGGRSAWERGNGTFTPVDDFDWEAYDQGNWKPKEAKVTAEHLRELFGNGVIWLKRADAAKQLQVIAKVGRTAAYDALKLDGRLGEMLHEREEDGFLGLRH